MQPSTTYLPNPFAPVGYGVNDASPESYIDRPFTYLYDVVLTANEQLTGQAVAIDTDSDFLWRAVLIATADGLFTVRFADASNYYLSSSQISSAALSTFGGQPFPVVPEVLYPAGGKITLDITDVSADDNTIEIAFIGAKRFRYR